MLANSINPPTVTHQSLQRLCLNRGVTDNFQQLLGGPYVLGEGGNVQISHQNSVLRPLIREMVGHSGQKIQLVTEFWVFLTVRHVTTRWNIEIVDQWAIFNLRTNMPAIDLFGPVLVVDLTKGKAGNYRHTVIGFFTTEGLVVPPRIRQRRTWEELSSVFVS